MGDIDASLKGQMIISYRNEERVWEVIRTKLQENRAAHGKRPRHRIADENGITVDQSTTMEEWRRHYPLLKPTAWTAAKTGAGETQKEKRIRKLECG